MKTMEKSILTQAGKVQIKQMSPTKVQIAWFCSMVHQSSRDSKIVSVIHLPLSIFITNLQAKLVRKIVKRNALNHLIAWHIRLETANAFFLTNVPQLKKKLNLLVRVASPSEEYYFKIPNRYLVLII